MAALSPAERKDKDGCFEAGKQFPMLNAVSDKDGCFKAGKQVPTPTTASDKDGCFETCRQLPMLAGDLNVLVMSSVKVRDGGKKGCVSVVEDRSKEA